MTTMKRSIHARSVFPHGRFPHRLLPQGRGLRSGVSAGGARDCRSSASAVRGAACRACGTAKTLVFALALLWGMGADARELPRECTAAHPSGRTAAPGCGRFAAAHGLFRGPSAADAVHSSAERGRRASEERSSQRPACCAHSSALLRAHPSVQRHMRPAVRRDDPPPTVQGALLRMDSATCDFGNVPRKGGDLVKDFTFANDGTGPRVITRVVTSCSCLRASFPKRPVPPGGEAAVRIVYEPHKSDPGVFHKVIQIYSNSVDGRHVITVQGCSVDRKER